MATTQNKTSFLIDIRQTKEYASFMQKIGWQVVRLDKDCQMFIKKLPLLPFSIAKILRSKKLVQLIKLKNIIKKYKVLFIKIQPFQITGDKDTSEVSRLTPPRWRIDQSPTIPTKTIWLDLLKSKNQLFTEMKAKTRYNIKKTQNSQPKAGRPRAEKLKTQIITGNKISLNQLRVFYNLWSKNKPFNWLFKPSFNELKYLVKSFGNKCFFVFAHHVILAKAGIYTNNYLDRFLVKPGMTKEILISSCLILTSSNMAFYWHNCSTKEGKKLFAPTLCVWQATLESKKRSLQFFDLEGIWDQRFPKLNQGWQGFSKFKQGFGGKEIEFITARLGIKV